MTAVATPLARTGTAAPVLWFTGLSGSGKSTIAVKVHHEFFRDHYPAWTAVGTPALFSKGAPMEIRAEAVIGSGRNPKVSIPPLPPGARPKS